MSSENKIGWEVIMKTAATWKTVDRIILSKKKNTNLHLCNDFKYAQLKKCMSTWREHGKIKVEQLQCLLAGPGSETTVISDLGACLV